MDDDRKKMVMIGVIVVCVAAAGGIYWTTRSGGSTGIDSIPDDKMMWVKCNNPDCGAEYQMPEKDFFKFLQENINPLANSEPPLTCKECGKKSIYRAIKCENCGKVFFRNVAGPDDHPDRCPHCNHSAEEAKRQERLNNQ